MSVLSKKPHIGLIGRNGAGKSVAANYFKQLGYTCVSLSDILRKLATKQNIDLDRQSLIAFGSQLKEQQGPDILAKKALDYANSLSKKTPIVFDSIRLEAEVLYLKESKVFMLGVDACIQTRYQRVQKRKNATDFVSFEEFSRQDEHEYLGKSSGQNIKRCYELCNVIINNDDSQEGFFKTLKDL